MVSNDAEFVVVLNQRKLANRSDRVKSVDLHPTEPWLVIYRCSCFVVYECVFYIVIVGI